MFKCSFGSTFLEPYAKVTTFFGTMSKTRLGLLASVLQVVRKFSKIDILVSHPSCHGISKSNSSQLGSAFASIIWSCDQHEY